MNQGNRINYPPPPPPPPPMMSQGQSVYPPHNQYQHRSGKPQHNREQRQGFSQGRGRGRSSNNQNVRDHSRSDPQSKQLVKPSMFQNPWAHFENTPQNNYIHPLCTSIPVNRAALNTQTTFTVSHAQQGRVREDEWWQEVPKQWRDEGHGGSVDVDDAFDAESPHRETHEENSGRSADQDPVLVSRANRVQAETDTLYDLFADE